VLNIPPATPAATLPEGAVFFLISTELSQKQKLTLMLCFNGAQVVQIYVLQDELAAQPIANLALFDLNLVAQAQLQDMEVFLGIL
jgi:hypothetical protein